MFEDLRTYPSAIAKVQTQILRLDGKIRKAQQELDGYTTDIEQAIATDPDLKNDQQRKAKRLELMRDSKYVVLADALADAVDRRTRLEIELQRHRNEFSVRKLEYRDHIASKEAAVA
ncbi:MAG: hypothetical protein NW224_16875 [Leptolyngbyaceae cyanobacterium bins.302]|nr:hypothetical protein [Leptolyngbyaceae cyanobacterium bins.302]